MKNVIRCMMSVVCSLGVASQSWAVGSSGIGNEVPSARAAGQGYVGVAGQNEDPTVIYENPAGLTNLKGTQITLGGTWENLHGNYEDNAGHETHMRSIDGAVPNMAISQSFMDGKVGSGVSVESPYGLETHWSGDSALRYVATNSVLHIVVVSPGVGYQINPMFSVGAAADYVNLFNASLEKHVSGDVINGAVAQANGQPVPAPGAPDVNSRLTGTASNWGYHMGVAFQPNEQNSFGLTYHSRVKLGVSGSLALTGLTGFGQLGFGGSDYSTTAETTLYLPQNIQFGYAFKPNAKWMLEADTAWYDWSPNHNLNVHLPNANPSIAPLLSAGSSQPLNWRDCWSFSSGANYKMTDRLQLRGGFWYEPWVQPESAFSPALMDLTRYGISTGIGYAVTQNFSVDASYNAVFFHSRTINNDIGAATGIPGYNINGNYSNFANVIGLNFSYRFGNK